MCQHTGNTRADDFGDRNAGGDRHGGSDCHGRGYGDGRGDRNGDGRSHSHRYG